MLVVYRARELTELVGLPPEQLRAIHAVKKMWTIVVTGRKDARVGSFR